MKDFAALKTALETDPRYDAAVVGGQNSATVGLLNEIETGQTIITDVTRRVALKAFKDAIRALSQQELIRLQLLMASADEDIVRTSDADIRDEIVNIFGGASDAVTRLTAAAMRSRTYGEAFGFSPATLNDVRQIVRLIAKSFIVSTGQA